MNTTVLDDPDRCEFVQKPPEYLHVKCPVCFDILLPEPYLVSCCGNHFCRKCIEALGKYEPCPLCKATHNAQFKVPDKGLARAIESLNIYCPNKDKSCDWAGPLGTVYDHLSAYCAFVNVPCKYKCNSSVVRGDLEIHESQRCPQRPETCVLCKLFSGTYVQVLRHKRKCPKGEISCPNECGSVFPRDSESTHMQECPKAPISCTFSYAGCEWVGAKCEHETHLEQEWRYHVSLISSHMMQVVADQDKVISVLSSRIEKQGKKIKTLTAHINSLKSSGSSPDSKTVHSEVKVNSTPVVQKPKNAPSAASSQSKDLPTATCTAVQQSSGVPLPFVPVGKQTLTFAIDQFKSRKSKNLSHYSTPFKLCKSTGYNMQLTLYLNGINEGLGTHISVYLNIMSVHYDDWVTKCRSCSVKLLVRLRSQTKTCDHHEKVISFEDSSVCAVDSFMSAKGLLNGTATFIKHSSLGPYLKNGRLVFELPQIIV